MAHNKIYDDYGKGKQELELQNKRKADEQLVQPPSKQPKISTFFDSSVIMKLCVDLVVESGRPFSIFKDKSMKTFVNLAKLQVRAKVEIHPESVKNVVCETATKKRSEIRQLLEGKVLSFSLDMATCRHKSFIGNSANHKM